MSAPTNEGLFARAQDVIPGGVSSPVRAFHSVGGTPYFVERAEDPYVLDVDVAAATTAWPTSCSCRQ